MASSKTTENNWKFLWKGKRHSFSEGQKGLLLQIFERQKRYTCSTPRQIFKIPCFFYPLPIFSYLLPFINLYVSVVLCVLSYLMWLWLCDSCLNYNDIDEAMLLRNPWLVAKLLCLDCPIVFLQGGRHCPARRNVSLDVVHCSKVPLSAVLKVQIHSTWTSVSPDLLKCNRWQLCVCVLAKSNTHK